MRKREIVFFCIIILFNKSAFSQITSFGPFENESRETKKNHGILYNTIINDDNVNIRSIPSIKGEKVGKLQKSTIIKIVGISLTKEYIDQYEGYWFNISLNGAESIGWVFSKYVDFKDVFTSELIIESANKDKWGKNQLKGYYMLGSNRVDVSINSGELSKDNYYTFYWDCSVENYHYSNIPGCYIWYPETGILKHITYFGGEMASSGFSKWIMLTEDHKYLIEDYGTTPHPREVRVWNLITNQLIYNGEYYKSVNLKDHSIEVVYGYVSYSMNNTWGEETKNLDNEVLQYGRSYLKNNKPSKEILENAEKGMNGISLIICCELNLDTKELKPINGIYINTM